MSTAQAIPLDPRPVPKEQKQRPAAREKQKRTTGRATVEDAEERTPVLAVLGTPSVSVARVAGTIRVSIVGGIPCLLIGKEDSETDQAFCERWESSSVGFSCLDHQRELLCICSGASHFSARCEGEQRGAGVYGRSEG